MSKMSRDREPAAQPDPPTRHQVHAEERRALRRMSASVRIAIGVAIVMAIVAGTVGISLVSLSSSSTNSSNVRALQQQNDLLKKQLALAETQVRANCRFYLDLTRSQTTLRPSSSPLAFSLIGDAFNSYTGLGCQPTYGPLPKPDPRIVKYLDNGGR